MSVRVRFAPSPTGSPHVGNIRTAIFNWLFARNMGGTFILRIEDTDRERYSKEALQALMDGLKWLNISWDEGPGTGGEYGPYFQSERLHIYHEYAKMLVDKGYAYYCSCTPERLKEVRESLKGKEKAAGYDRHCRDLGIKGDPNDPDKVIRFKVPLEGKTYFEDYIRGRIEFDNELLDDFVIIKSDGYPTYHLANIVDDYLMKVTHIMRGDEWISSTGRHILLYEGLGQKPPVFVHLPIILGPDKSKLSKRHGATSIIEYEGMGYLPECLFNFLALLGWSPKDDREIMTIDEMVESFSIDGINQVASVFDHKKLDWMNGLYLRSLDLEYIAEKAKPFFENAGIDIDDNEKYKRIIDFARNRIPNLSGIVSESEPFFRRLSFNSEEKALIDENKSQRIYAYWVEELSKKAQWSEEDINDLVKRSIQELELKGKEFYFPLRLALFGSFHGPDIPVIFNILGRDQVVARLQRLMKS
ncbi:glutamate--tRNA ligase [bacterium]|nr:glutamate--tRNA ligase [bacterium]